MLTLGVAFDTHASQAKEAHRQLQHLDALSDYDSDVPKAGRGVGEVGRVRGPCMYLGL